MIDIAPAVHRWIPAPAWLVVSALFHYVGPALAVSTFALAPPATIAWLRIATAAVVLTVWRRPWRAFRQLASGSSAT